MNGPPNAIGWCDCTWNPITGCLHGCRFGPNQTPCYAEVIAERFRGGQAFPDGFAPTFHPARLDEPRRLVIPARIFTCSMADLFGSWVPRAQIDAVLTAIRATPWHTFQLLTKAPWIAKGFPMPDHVWLGGTVTGGLQRESHRLDCIRQSPARVRYVSYEPVEGPIDIARAEPQWVIIGAATGKGGYQPEDRWVRDVEHWCDRNGVPVYHKDNLTIRRGARREEFPDGQTVRTAGYFARGRRARLGPDRRLPMWPSVPSGAE